jgi:hypothetical protein
MFCISKWVQLHLFASRGIFRNKGIHYAHFFAHFFCAALGRARLQCNLLDTLGIRFLLKKRMMTNSLESSSKHFQKVSLPLHLVHEPEFPTKCHFWVFFLFFSSTQIPSVIYSQPRNRRHTGNNADTLEVSSQQHSPHPKCIEMTYEVCLRRCWQLFFFGVNHGEDYAKKIAALGRARL